MAHQQDPNQVLHQLNNQVQQMQAAFDAAAAAA